MLLPNLLASSQIVEKTDEAFYWMGGITLFFLVGITAAMLYFAIRYGRKRHPKAAHIEGNTALEITWIVIPTIIVLFMFWKGFEGFLLMRNPPPDAMEIEVEGRQWFWTFRYPEIGVTSNELYVPVGKPIKLKLSAPLDDVIHSFYLPAFRVKEDCVPGYETHLWFQADRADVYDVFCAEFCGKDHARMITKMHAVPMAEYRAWLQKKAEERFRPITVAEAMDPGSEGLAAIDAATLYGVNCASCHGEKGQGGLVEGARSFRSLEGWKRSPKIVDIFRTLTEGIQGTQMNAFPNLSSWEKFALAYHVRSLYAGDDAPASTEAEFAKLVEDYKLDQQREVRLDFPIDDAIEALTEEAGSDDGDGNR